LPRERYRNLFPFKLFEFIHEEEDDKIEAPVLMGIYRLCTAEAINTFPPFMSVRKSLLSGDLNVRIVFCNLSTTYKGVLPI
jgi:hypothetical protein